MARKFLGLDRKEDMEMPHFWGFNLPETYVYETVAEYLSHNILPRAGGWDDQLSAWKDDLYTIQTIMAWEQNQEKQKKSGGMTDDFTKE